MNSTPAFIVLTAGQSGVLLACLLLPPALLGLWLYRRTSRQLPADKTLDWSIPPLEIEGASMFHRWAPAVKISVLLATCFLLVALRSLFWSGVGLLATLAAVHLAQIPWQRVARRLTAMGGLLAVLLVVLPLTSAIRPNETLIVLPALESWPLRFSGLLLALTITCKAISVALLMEPMLATAPLARTIQGFADLGMPAPLLQMILLCYRYLFVFQQEMGRMQRSARVRGFTPRSNFDTLRTMGNCLGMLFIRSFERTERVYEAMLSRGYRGAWPGGSRAPVCRRDVILGGIWLLFALGLLVLDRLWPVPWA